MWQFNLIVTLAAEGRFQPLWMELMQHGDFRKTEFFGVIAGRIDDPPAFFEFVSEKRDHQSLIYLDIGRIVPLDRCLTFSPDTFEERIREALVPYIDRLDGQRFYVRIERRGLKGRIVSPEVERELDEFLQQELIQRQGSAQIDFDNPDLIVAIETLGTRCGIGLISRELLQCYDFVRVP